MSRYIEYGEPSLLDDYMQEVDVAAHEKPLARVGKMVNASLSLS